MKLRCALLVVLGLVGCCLFAQVPQAPQSPPGDNQPAVAQPPRQGVEQAPSRRNIDFLGGQPPFRTYIEPSQKERRAWYFKQVFSTGGVLSPAISAVIDQYNHEIPEWRQGAAGFGKRLGWRELQYVSQDAMEWSLSAALHEDTWYYRCSCTGFFPRLKHAMASEFIARTKSGKRTFSVPRIAGDYGSSMLSIVVLPGRYRALHDGVRYGNWYVVSDLGFNFFREFWPDIKWTLFHKR